MNVIAIVQARMSSTRLPGKVMAPIEGKPMIEVLLSRLSRSSLVDEIILATSNEELDNPLAEFVNSLGFEVYRGSLSDVRSRFVDISREKKPKCIVRVTADCPLVDPEVVDAAIKEYLSGDWEYVSNTSPATFPDGIDVEVFPPSSLERSVQISSSREDIEHVTPLFRSDSFRHRNIEAQSDFSSLRWTVDTDADLKVIRTIFEHFSPDIHFTWNQVLKLYRERPQLFKENRMETRNQGSKLGQGQKLWQRAKQIIPGGNMLLSKRSEMFLPELWPSYFSRAEGSRVWDLDGNEFIDMSTMGVGTNVLGYQNQVVDESVIKVVKSGTMSTLNCPEEVYLAEELLAINPWAQMVKLARTGGEANAIAIRIARAASGKDKVAVCGYHGWHDWYLSANLNDDQSLDGHLLPGLEPKGVPRSLAGSIVTFPYNDLASLEEIVGRGDVGVIKMEVIRTDKPNEGFLSGVRELATRFGIVLVFDECTSGFRETFGGIHKKYGVEPDIAVYGKALGNGYPITAVVGRSEVMDAAQSTFISSTFWTDRVGPTAAIATLGEMKRLNSWEVITEKGVLIQSFWRELFSGFPMEIKITGIPSLAGFTSSDERFGVFKTFVTQELLKKGILGSNTIYSSISHTSEDWEVYKQAMIDIVSLSAPALQSGSLENMLEVSVSHQGFRRLN